MALRDFLHLLDSIPNAVSPTDLRLADQRKLEQEILAELNLIIGLHPKTALVPVLPIPAVISAPILPLSDKPVEVQELCSSATADKLILSPDLIVMPDVIHLAVSPEIITVDALTVVPITYAKKLVSKIHAATAATNGKDHKILDNGPPLTCHSSNDSVPPSDTFNSQSVVDNPITTKAYTAPDDIAVLSPDAPALDPWPPVLRSIPALKISAPDYNSLDPCISVARHCRSVILHHAAGTVEDPWSLVLRNRRRRPLRSAGVPQLLAAPPTRPRPPNIPAPLHL